jgi:UDPglucose--hexose-1-phosphate uridylyltransferase
MEGEDRRKPRPTSPATPAGELRWNPLTARWVVIAPGRSKRPVEEAEPPEGRSRDLPHESAPIPSCPLCPGNESELPAIVWQSPGNQPGGWSARAVPNRFPAFRPESNGVQDARGHQEVLIESPIHRADLCSLDAPALERVVELYVERYRAVASLPGTSRVLLFRNRGRNAGNSLRHPHAQLVGIEFDPPLMRERDRSFRELRNQEGGHCPLCRPETFEPEFEARILFEGTAFRAWVPWAAESPFEVWIAPRRHVPDFRDLVPDEAVELAELLGRLTRRYRDVAGDPDYNLLLHSAGPRDQDADALHWWIRLRPRVGTPAGLELLSGVLINPSSPLEDAHLLRDSSPGGTAGG